MKPRSLLRLLLLAVSFQIVIVYTILRYNLRKPTQPSRPVAPQQTPSRLLPHKYWEHRRVYPENYKQISCSKFPTYDEIHYAAASWQHLLLVNGSIYVYGAYWDDRFDESWVRVLVFCDFIPLPDLRCHLWYENENAPVTVQANITYAWDTNWGGPMDGVNEPYILGCPASHQHHPMAKQRAPAAVSILLENQICGTPSNVLNVQGAPAFNETRPLLNNSSISVCLKSLHFTQDISAELVEWIELIKALGANKIFVFEVKSHPNTRRVLDYYATTGFVDLTAFVHPPQLRSAYPPAAQDFHDLRRDLLPLNDCLYRSINKYQWLTPIDTDEMIVPRSHITWQQMIAEEIKPLRGVDALGLRNYYFLDTAKWDIAAPLYMKKLGQLWRSKEPNPEGLNVKSFHNTSSVLAMHNHYPMSCAGPYRCWSRDFNVSVARLHHYRRCKKEENYSFCRLELYEIEKDDVITKWKYVIKEVDRVLAGLEIEPKVNFWFWRYFG